MTCSQLSFIAEDLRNASRNIAPAANGRAHKLDIAQYQLAQRQIERALAALASIADCDLPLLDSRNTPIIINIAKLRKAA